MSTYKSLSFPISIPCGKKTSRLCSARSVRLPSRAAEIPKFQTAQKKKHPQLNRPALIDKTFLPVPAGRTTGWIWKIPRFFHASVGGCICESSLTRTIPAPSCYGFCRHLATVTFREKYWKHQDFGISCSSKTSAYRQTVIPPTLPRKRYVLHCWSLGRSGKGWQC